MRERHVNLRGNMKVMIVVFIAMFALLVGYLFYSIATFGDRWFGTTYNPRLAAARETVTAGDITERDGYVLATTQGGSRTYADSRKVRVATSHIVGDTLGLTRGAETFFAKRLYGFDDGVVGRVEQLMSGGKSHGNDIALTIGGQLSRDAYGCISDYDAAAVVLNYKTGEIYACVSSPAFDQNELADYEGGDGTELFNRATMGRYAPGSTFKIVTAAALLQNPAADIGEIECTGSVDIGGYTVSCAGGEAHGTVDLETAFTRSCNVYFALSAQSLGGKLGQTAAAFRFNDDFRFDDIVLYESSYSAGTDKVALGMSGIGQGEDLVTPLHMAMIAGSIANDGVMMEPKLLLKETSPSGTVMYNMSSGVYTRTVSATVAQKLQAMMESVVTDGTGSRAAIDGRTVAGKTGTAQYTDADGDLREHAWFAGYLADDEHPLAVAVLIEGGGSGGRVAAPVARNILRAALELGY